MKRAYADLDDRSSSSSPKRPRKATRHTSTLAIQDPSSQTSKGSSPSTVVASPPAPSPTTSSLEDSCSNDTTSEPGSDSSTSSQSDSGSSNTFSSESEFFQRPIGRDPNDSQESHYNSDIDSGDSDTDSSDSEPSERPVGWKAREHHSDSESSERLVGWKSHEHHSDSEGWKAHFVLSAFEHRPINWATDSTSTRLNWDPEYGPSSSTSASILDDVSEASSSVSQASSSSSGSSSSSEPAPASENSNLSSSSSASLSTSPSDTTTTHTQLSTSNLSQLQSRLQTLLPQLQSANQELEVEKNAGRLGERDIEKVEEEGERYIEMELGLGVLEERREGGGKEEDKQADEGDVLGRLMGKKGKRKGRGSRKVAIEEIGG